MALQRVLEVLLEEVRDEIIRLRDVKTKIKLDLEDETGETVPVSDRTARALTLADAVSYEIWGGARGWERANDEQFEVLVQTLKEKLRATNTDECCAPVRREGRVPGEPVSPDDRGSQPVDYHPLAEATRDPEHFRKR